MNIYIVIPAYNEEEYLAQTLNSLVEQSFPAKKIVVVNDNSTDRTQEIIDEFSLKFESVISVRSNSKSMHEPGSKVVNAFYTGFEYLDDQFDLICKFDADLIFPSNYLDTIVSVFKNDSKCGMAGGFCYIKNADNWELEKLTNQDHIRGALKAYRKECFEQIGGLKRSMGWDTVDELLAQYHGWNVITDPSLQVKHLKPTGSTYSSKVKYKQGEAFYKMRYGFFLMIIASSKLALKKQSIRYLFDSIMGFQKARRKKTNFLVSPDEGKFIRNLRWKGIKNKLFKSNHS